MKEFLLKLWREFLDFILNHLKKTGADEVKHEATQEALERAKLAADVRATDSGADLDRLRPPSRRGQNLPEGF